jgi:uncharacterized membrane protein YfcA
MIWIDISLLVLIGLVAGFVKGTSSFGSSLVAVPLLFRLGFTASEVVTIMITCNIALNLMLINEHKKYYTWENTRTILPIIISGVIFTGVGLFLNELLADRVIEIIAFVLIISAILVKAGLLKIKLKDTFLNLFIVGMLSGTGNGIASVDGPPVVLYLTGVNADKERFKSTLSIHFFVMGIVGVIILAIFGNYNPDVLLSTLTLFCGLVIGLYTGIYFSRRINEQQFSKIVLIILVGLAATLLIP